MKVCELLEILSTMPKEADVVYPKYGSCAPRAHGINGVSLVSRVPPLVKKPNEQLVVLAGGFISLEPWGVLVQDDLGLMRVNALKELNYDTPRG